MQEETWLNIHTQENTEIQMKETRLEADNESGSCDCG